MNLINAMNPNDVTQNNLNSGERLKKVVDQMSFDHLKKLEGNYDSTRNKLAALEAQGPQDKLALQLGLAADFFDVAGNKNHAAIAQKVLSMDPRAKQMAALKDAMSGQESALANAYNKLGTNDQFALAQLRQKGELAKDARAAEQAEKDVENAVQKGFDTSYGKGMGEGASKWALTERPLAQEATSTYTGVINQLTELDKRGVELFNIALGPNNKPMMEQLNPKAQGIRSQINTISLKKLKPLLGGAFSKAEAEWVQAMELNPALSTKENIRKLVRARAVIDQLMAVKDDLLRKGLAGDIKNYDPTKVDAQMLKEFRRLLAEGSEQPVEKTPSVMDVAKKDRESSAPRQRVTEMMKQYREQKK